MESINYSIIIPHYDIPDLLMRCLKSIPVREDVQVIVVDDCSPGADKYLEQYPELSRPYLEFYSTPQGGSAGRARNVGLEHAKGKWLLFIDADDFYVDNMEYFLNEYVNREEDIIFFASQSVKSDDLSPSSRNFYNSYFTRYEKTGRTDEFRYFFHAQWGKFIKHSIIKQHNLKFDETKYSNDVYFGVSTGLYAKNIKIINDVIYIVTERSGSLTSDNNRTQEEWFERYSVALNTQKLLDANHVVVKKPDFVHFLNIQKERDKKEFLKHFLRLSYKHKKIYLRCWIQAKIDFIHNKY